jgi:hypothetical protein
MDLKRSRPKPKLDVLSCGEGLEALEAELLPADTFKLEWSISMTTINKKSDPRKSDAEKACWESGRRAAMVTSVVLCSLGDRKM